MLVILSSSLERGLSVPGLDIAAALPEIRLERLDSTEFKGLMPCYEVVVATREGLTPRLLSEQLKAAGVDHYLKPSGAHIGPRPELSGACSAMREPPAGSERVAFLEPGLGIALPIDAALTAPLLDAAPALQAVDEEQDRWRARTPARSVGAATVGQALRGLRYDGGPVTCTVQAWAVGVSGRPHFGMRDAGLQAPACGSPRIYAEVDCDADLVLLNGAGQAGRFDGPWEPGGPALAPAAWQPALDAARTAAAANGAPVTERWRQRKLSLPDGPARVLELTLQTGEGEWFCGGEDHHAVFVGLVGQDGASRLAPVDITGSALRGVVDSDGDGVFGLHLDEEITGSQRLLGDGGDAALPRAYCDCPC